MKWSKRLFDLCFALPGLVLLAPIFLLIAVLIKLDGGGPVFYRQERVGYRGRRFRIWKFRTMVVGAERHGVLTIGNDPRVTRVGRWLRRFKLDELPQLINVVLGDMSLVGPRPEVPKYVALYTEKELQVLDLMPGITDPASVAFRHENEILGRSLDPERTYVQFIIPEKVSLNLDYARKATVLTDCIVILKTLATLLRVG